MEIENTTLGGNYSQKVHFRTHHFGGTNGKRLTITEKGNVGISTEDPINLLDISTISSDVPLLNRSLRVGFDGTNYVASGMNPGNSDTIPHLWVGNDNSDTVSASSFTHGFGWFYNTNGNYELCYKKGSASAVYNAFTVSRNDGCVTCTNTTCCSDDRLKFNERNIENTLETIMKLSPEIYDKVFENPISQDMQVTSENSKVESGFIAQEVEAIPEFVHLVYTSTDKFKLKSVNYVGIIPYNTRTIQELSLQNDELKKQNKDLEHGMDELKKKLDVFMHKFENQ